MSETGIEMNMHIDSAGLKTDNKRNENSDESKPNSYQDNVDYFRIHVVRTPKIESPYSHVSEQERESESRSQDIRRQSFHWPPL